MRFLLIMSGIDEGYDLDVTFGFRRRSTFANPCRTFRNSWLNSRRAQHDQWLGNNQAHCAAVLARRNATTAKAIALRAFAGAKPASMAAAKLRLHGTTRLDSVVAGVDFHVGPVDDMPVRDVVPQCYLVRKADRQRSGLKACGGRHQLAPDGGTAFAAEHFPRAQIAFRDRGHIAAKTVRLPRRFAAQGRRKNRDIQFEPDQMIRL